MRFAKYRGGCWTNAVPARPFRQCQGRKRAGESELALFSTLLIPLLVLSACHPANDTVQATSTETPTATSPPGDPADVVRVLDGDSLLAKPANGPEVEVRLLGINAPEGSECFGDEARDALTSLLGSASMTLVSDSQPTDQFDRSLRYVYVDGINVNLEMIRTGNALVLQTDHSLNDEFIEAGDRAATSPVGMWDPGACGSDSLPPSVAVAGFVFDPPGRDTENLNGEWVAISNEGTDTVDLTGWTLRDESTQNRFEFPNSFSITPGDRVFVHSGCGEATDTDLFWCARDPVWSNGGDTIILQSIDGSIIARERYDGDF